MVRRVVYASGYARVHARVFARVCISKRWLTSTFMPSCVGTMFSESAVQEKEARRVTHDEEEGEARDDRQCGAKVVDVFVREH